MWHRYSIGWRFERWFSFSVTDVYGREVCPGGVSRFKETSQRATLEDRPKKAAHGLETSSGGKHRWHAAETVWNQSGDVVLITLFCISGLGLDEEPRCRPSSPGRLLRMWALLLPPAVSILLMDFNRGNEVWFAPYT